jgi:hypothetical protein
MTAVTTIRKPKQFAWSWSKLKNFETCPRKHQEVDILKNYNDTSEHLTWGNSLHAAMASRIADGEVLPETMKQFEAWANRVQVTAATWGMRAATELKLAITPTFERCDYFDKYKPVWFRCVVDVLLQNGPVGVILDWKTGKVNPDSQQLALTAIAAFAHFPELQEIKTIFVWLDFDGETEETFLRNDIPTIWANVLPRISMLEQAAKVNHYPPKPGGLCRKHCPVRTCEFYGVGSS